MSTIGGSLGLYLGFSLLDSYRVIESFVQLLANWRDFMKFNDFLLLRVVVVPIHEATLFLVVAFRGAYTHIEESVNKLNKLCTFHQYV